MYSYYKLNKAKALKKSREYYRTHKKQKQEYRKKHKKIIAKWMKNYGQIHKEILKDKKRKYYIKNKSKIKIKRRIYMRNKRKNNHAFRILNNLSRRLIKLLNGRHKVSITKKLIGCSAKKLKQHLESKFKSGMSWDNYGRTGWHIDHIRPCVSFDLSKLSEQRKCFHYTNLQPLWAIDNIKKRDKLISKI
jgi:hypothetical protein